MFHRDRIFTVIGFILLVLVISVANQKPLRAEESHIQEPITVNVILQRKYLDGEVSEELTKETIGSMEDFWAMFASWQLVEHNQERIVLKKDIDDISPLLKTNGYFGLAGDGTLSIFNGKPTSNEVIQSFFQIDMEKLESHKHIELIEGIRIQSKDQYLEVLKTLETYSKTEKK
ncbi:BofC C-terminal domain-containing protein [Bacillus weihaiensis]|uniref:Bypass-of-forespore protein C n=1 Tax=Bacillus weihaiensis TaxID=1547283 RepID=A0A1L3MPI1_9BACI|nr:BofC C-terminal domain-containing protein [Bacillus weihaiensis]APH04250.1 hypothetical protein A9C19_05560 [Bacillus weihaiensis]